MLCIYKKTIERKKETKMLAINAMNRVNTQRDEFGKG